MIASHGGNQYLVAVAGGATSLFDDQAERGKLVKKVALDDDQWIEEAWSLPAVQRANKGNRERFLRHWKKNEPWFPTWKCLAEHYLGLANPVVLDPQNLTGRGKLITMYASYQEIDRSIAIRVLDLIPKTENQNVLPNLQSLCQADDQDLSIDISRIEFQKSTNQTTGKALIDARLGQGKFREDLMRLWDSACAVTGCTVPEVLRASHVKPWRKCSNKERLDSQNGLLLGANLDALFDDGLISFEDNGEMLVSDHITAKDRRELGLGRKLRKVPSELLTGYLRYHRNYVARATRRVRQQS
jgi:HNH endonuclease